MIFAAVQVNVPAIGIEGVDGERSSDLKNKVPIIF
jgi:hypothetical protein